MIQVKNLVKKYKASSQCAVDNISFEVKSGEFFAFLGPNGAGKTTTISILTTTLSKSSGEIYIDGIEIDKDPQSIRKKIGVIFQKPSLDLNLTAEENIRFHSSLYGIYRLRPLFSLMPQEYQTRVYELAELLEIKKEIFSPIKSFSGGMRRKLEIIRTLMHRPKVLFLDEPTSGLDPLSRKNLWEYLKQIRAKDGTTVFLTTHYLDEAEGADNVCIIKEGKIVISGTPKYIKSKLLSDYVVFDTNEPFILKEALANNGISSQILDSNSVKAEISGSRIQGLFKNLTVPILDLKVINPTLEEAYLEIISSKGGI